MFCHTVLPEHTALQNPCGHKKNKNYSIKRHRDTNVKHKIRKKLSLTGNFSDRITFLGEKIGDRDTEQSLLGWLIGGKLHSGGYTPFRIVSSIRAVTHRPTPAILWKRAIISSGMVDWMRTSS